MSVTITYVGTRQPTLTPRRGWYFDRGGDLVFLCPTSRVRFYPKRPLLVVDSDNDDFSSCGPYTPAPAFRLDYTPDE